MHGERLYNGIPDHDSYYTCLAVNIVMLLTNTTQTVDVDIWDYWHFAFTGALVAVVTGNQMYGIIAAILNMVIIMVLVTGQHQV